jgi:hypothetical protein
MLNTPTKSIISVFANCLLAGALINDHLTFCRRFLQRAEQVLASRRPLKESLQIKHFLEAIFFVFCFG